MVFSDGEELIYVVRAVKSRAEYVEEIRKQIPELIVYWDEFGSARESYVHTCKNIVGDKRCVLMEDDIILTANFKEKIEKVISKNPDILINFFSLSKKYTTPHFKKGREFCMDQCVYLPKGFGTRIAEAYKTWPDKDKYISAVDFLTGYAWGKNKDYLVWCPSLVQHRACKSVINPKRSSKRQSITFKKE